MNRRSFLKTLLLGAGALLVPKVEVPEQGVDYGTSESYTSTTEYKMWEGKIQEAAVWDRALTHEELNYIHNDNAGGTYAERVLSTNPVAYWNVSEPVVRVV
jgi:hypothetical protein